jgi:hypothetical protein
MPGSEQACQAHRQAAGMARQAVCQAYKEARQAERQATARNNWKHNDYYVQNSSAPLNAGAD